MRKSSLIFHFFALLLALLTPALLLASCGGNATYSDRSLAALTDAVFAEDNAALPVKSDFSPASEDFVDLNFEFVPTRESDVLYLSNSASINDQIGIFKRATPAEAQKLADDMKPKFDLYVSEMKRIAQLYPSEDAATEMAKLDNAKITVYGQYVLLTVLDKAQTKAVQSAFEASIRG